MDHLSWKTCMKISVCLFVLWLATNYWNTAVELTLLFLKAAAPLLIGLVIAYILNILMSFYEKQPVFATLKSNTRRGICILLAIISFVFIISCIFGLVIPELTLCLKLLFAKIPRFIDELLKSDFIRQLLPTEITNDLISSDWQEFLNKLLPMLTTGIGTIGSLVSSVFSATISFLVSFIFSIYLLISKERLQNQVQRVLNAVLAKEQVQRLKEILSVFNDSFHQYLVGQCLEAVILGALCALGMLILRLPYAVMIGTLIGFTALIPVAGAYIGASIGAIMIVTISPLQALLFLAFIVILQQIEGNLIYPKVVGSSLGLPALWVLAAVTIGGGMMGIIGMLLGVPISAALYRLCKEAVLKREAMYSVQTEQCDKESL